MHELRTHKRNGVGKKNGGASISCMGTQFDEWFVDEWMSIEFSVRCRCRMPPPSVSPSVLSATRSPRLLTPIAVLAVTDASIGVAIGQRHSSFTHAHPTDVPGHPWIRTFVHLTFKRTILLNKYYITLQIMGFINFHVEKKIYFWRE